MTETLSEKRKFYRQPMSMPIQYQEVNSRGPERSSSVDVSEGGVCFLGRRFLARGSHLNVTIPVGDQIFKINAQVAYCNHIPSLERYRIGVAFLDSSSAFRAKLATQIYEIKEYRHRVSRGIGREISEEEAARQWIEKYAQHFSSLF